MPSVSAKQARFMRIAAHNPEFAKKIGIKPEVAKEWHEEDKKKGTADLPEEVSTEGRLKELIQVDGVARNFVFLGGTTGGDDWRSDLTALDFQMDYFNPVVEVWSDSAKKLEDLAKKEACMHLYVITPCMVGNYSIAELTEQAVLNPACTVVCFLKEIGDKVWTEHQDKSNAAIIELIKSHGAVVYDKLEDVAEHCNFVNAVLNDYAEQEEY